MHRLQSMTFAAYRAIDAVNWSSLREMRVSPAQYRYRLDHPREDTTDLAFGRGAHAAVFEPDRLPLEFAVWKGARRAGAAWQAFRAVHGDDTILKASEYERCIAIRDAVRAHAAAAALLRAGWGERAILWTDAETGLRCKARLDFFSSAPMLVDLKTTDDLARFGWTSEQVGYHCQLAFYLRGLRALGLEAPARIIAAERRPPHHVELVALSASALTRGEAECRRLLRLVADCTARREWPQAA
jgi:PDDEXK-like domain of unknown function (DUF3799)